MAEPTIHLKTCVKCCTVKPTKEFYKDCKQVDDLTRQCKECVQAYRKAHFRRLRALPAPEFKRCPYCGMTKRRREFGSNIRGRGGIATYCKLCSALKSSEFRKIHPDKTREWNRRYNEHADKEHIRAVHTRWRHGARGQELHRLTVLRKYGLTPEDYEQMLAVQGEGCAICGAPEPGGRSKTPRLHIDHDHGTKKVRGLLCNSCNRGLGYFKDSPILLTEAAGYISFYRKNTSESHRSA